MTCTFSLRLQTVVHTHTYTGLRLKTPMRIRAEEGQLHRGFVHSLIQRPSCKQKCANHTHWGVPKQTQGITTTERTLDLWTNAFWNNSNIKFYEKRNVMKYRTSAIFSQKHAYRYGFSPNANCPICPCTDSALHILSGCQYTEMRNMIINAIIRQVCWLSKPYKRDHAVSTKLPTLM